MRTIPSGLLPRCRSSSYFGPQILLISSRVNLDGLELAILADTLDLSYTSLTKRCCAQIVSIVQLATIYTWGSPRG